MKHRCKKLHGFDIILTGLNKQVLSDDFLKDIDNLLLEPAGSPQEEPVLLGAVDSAHNLPKWFPWKVQYQFPGCEYTVGKLWLIANNRHAIFIVDAHPHDLAALCARYSRVHQRSDIVTEPSEPNHLCEA